LKPLQILSFVADNAEVLGRISRRVETALCTAVLEKKAYPQ